VVATTAVTAVATDVVTVCLRGPSEDLAPLVCPLPPPQIPGGGGAPQMAGGEAAARQKRLRVPHSACRRDGCSQPPLLRSSVGLERLISQPLTVHETGPPTSRHAWTSRRARLYRQQVTPRLSDPPFLEHLSPTFGGGVASMTHDTPVLALEQPRASPELTLGPTPLGRVG